MQPLGVWSVGLRNAFLGERNAFLSLMLEGSGYTSRLN